MTVIVQYSTVQSSSSNLGLTPTQVSDMNINININNNNTVTSQGGANLTRTPESGCRYIARLRPRLSELSFQQKTRRAPFIHSLVLPCCCFSTID